MSEPTRYSELQTQADQLGEMFEALAPPDAFDPVIEAIKKDVDRTQLRQNLELTQEERAQKFVSFVRLAQELREAGRRSREKDPSWGLK